MKTSMKAVPIVCAAVLLSARAAECQKPLHFLSKQCNEDAIRLHVDPNPFRQVVGSQFRLALEEGKAVVLMLCQVCAQDWMDGEPLGPTQEVHVWVAIEGENDVRPVVGAQVTRPTSTWFSVFDGNTNARAREARRSSGRRVNPIDAVVLDPPGPQRGGRVSLSKDLSYSWSVTSAPSPARLVGVNHDVYARDPAGNVFLNRFQVLLDIAALNSPGTMEVTGSTDLLHLIPVGRYSVSVNTFFPVWVRATLGISPST